MCSVRKKQVNEKKIKGAWRRQSRRAKGKVMVGSLSEWDVGKERANRRRNKKGLIRSSHPRLSFSLAFPCIASLISFSFLLFFLMLALFERTSLAFFYVKEKIFLKINVTNNALCKGRENLNFFHKKNKV